MDVDSDHSEQADSDCRGRGTDDNCDIGGNNGPIDPNVIDEMNENPLLVPPDQDSPSHVLNALNDDCLYEAFKRLDILDLLNVAKVCIRFEAQAKAAFQSKYKDLHLNIEQCDRNAMTSILNVFGSFIQSLCITSNMDAADGDLFRAIIKNCSPELKELVVVNFDIQVDTPNLRLPFLKLEKLVLVGCAGNLGLAHLIDNCPELKQIFLVFCIMQGVNGMINRRFEKLQELHIVECEFDIGTNALEQFIVSNPAVTKLVISRFVIRTSTAIRLISQHMLQLQELKLALSIDDVQHIQRDIQCIGQLRSLKSLALDFNWMDVAPLMDALATNDVPLEALSIFNGSINRIAMKHIAQLQKITSLTLYGVDGLNEEHLIDSVRNLPELQDLTFDAVTNEDGDDVLTIDGLIQMLHYSKKLSTLSLYLFNGLTINTDHYGIMLDTLRNRSEKIKLHVTIQSKKSKLNVPMAVLQANTDILSIEIGVGIL